jgi:parallel beta-helix repeat protein
LSCLAQLRASDVDYGVTRSSSSLAAARWLALACCWPLAGCSSSGDALGTPQDLTVGPSASADYASIGEAIAAAPPGSTITVEPGSYTEALFISKPLTIVGAGAGSAVEYPAGGPADAAVIEVREVQDVHLESLTVRAALAGVDGLRVRDATNVTLLSIIAENNTGDGIDIKRSGAIVVAAGRFEGNGGDGVQVDESSHDVTISGCESRENAADGFRVQLSTNVVVEASTATLNLDDGIIVDTATGVQLLGNVSTNNADWGISVEFSPDTALQGNTASGNAGGQIRCEPDPCPAGGP